MQAKIAGVKEDVFIFTVLISYVFIALIYICLNYIIKSCFRVCLINYLHT